MKRSEEEILQGYQDSLGENLGKQFFLLEKDFMVLKLYMKYLVQFFTEENSIEAIYNSDKLFFNLVRTSMVQYVVIGIGKMLDKDSKRNNNLNLYILQSNEDEELGLMIKNAEQEYEGKFRDFRRKLYAHADLPHRMGEKNLENFNITELQVMVNLIEKVFECFYRFNFETEKYYAGLVQSRSFDYVIRQIENSRKLVQLERQAYKEGTVPHNILMEDAEIALFSKNYFDIKTKEN